MICSTLRRTCSAGRRRATSSPPGTASPGTARTHSACPTCLARPASPSASRTRAPPATSTASSRSSTTRPSSGKWCSRSPSAYQRPQSDRLLRPPLRLRGQVQAQLPPGLPAALLGDGRQRCKGRAHGLPQQELRLGGRAAPGAAGHPGGHARHLRHHLTRALRDQLQGGSPRPLPVRAL